jgi:hypothetical protein
MSVDENQGLDDLYQDVRESELPEPELLARYADDPESLSEDERRQVEAARARSPIVADELATLSGFDMSVFGGAESVAPETGAQVIPLRRRVWQTVKSPPVALALAASVAALAVWFTGVDPPREEAPWVAQEEPPPAEERLAPEPTLPAPIQSPEREIQIVDRPPTPPAPEQPTPQTEAPPEPSRQFAEIESDEPAAESAPSPTPPSPPAQILIAMAMPDYAAPTGSDIFGPGASVYRSREPSGSKLTALSPAHRARSTRESPSLHWHLAALPESGAFYLTILDEESDEEIAVDRVLAIPQVSGLQRIDLAELGIALPAGRGLRWSVAHRPEPDSPPTDFAFGWIEAAAPGADTGECSGALELAERPAACARAGYWYDALEATLELRRLHPESDQPAEALRRLATQAGLGELDPL